MAGATGWRSGCRREWKEKRDKDDRWRDGGREIGKGRRVRE